MANFILLSSMRARQTSSVCREVCKIALIKHLIKDLKANFYLHMWRNQIWGSLQSSPGTDSLTSQSCLAQG